MAAHWGGPEPVYQHPVFLVIVIIGAGLVQVVPAFLPPQMLTWFALTTKDIPDHPGI
jgi:hypothetical protein